MKKPLLLLIGLLISLTSFSQDEDQEAVKTAIEVLRLVKLKDYQSLYDKLNPEVEKPKIKAFQQSMEKAYVGLAQATVDFDKYRVKTLSKNVLQYRFLMLPEIEDPVYFAVTFKEGNFQNILAVEVLLVEVVYH